MSHETRREDDGRLASHLRSAVTGGDPTNTARLETIAKACATASLRVADEELGAPVDEGPGAPDDDVLTNPDNLGSDNEDEESDVRP